MLMSKAKKSRTNRPDKGNEIKMAQEAEWIQRASQGDQEAFDKLYETHIEFIYNYFLSRIRNSSVAQTLTAKTLTDATRALVQGHYTLRDEPFKLWLYNIANTVLLEHNYRSPREEQDPLWRIIHEFPFTEQQILAMRHLDHLLDTEIALLLGLSEEDCRQLYRQALVNLKKRAQERGLWDDIVKGKQELS
jgi:DNA-directed RNA polymerase specialized sigma24 family protein